MAPSLMLLPSHRGGTRSSYRRRLRSPPAPEVAIPALAPTSGPPAVFAGETVAGGCPQEAEPGGEESGGEEGVADFCSYLCGLVDLLK